jgi:hypothetical protein
VKWQINKGLFEKLWIGQDLLSMPLGTPTSACLTRPLSCYDRLPLLDAEVLAQQPLLVSIQLGLGDDCDLWCSRGVGRGVSVGVLGS